MRSMSSGSSMLEITSSRPPQRTHCSISIPNTRFKRRAQFSATWIELHSLPGLHANTAVQREPRVLRHTFPRLLERIDLYV